ncbi:hypothetical protein [Bosea sp. ASV33]|uniref:hypothetical protein n=1 Tax=Bosea sp. ASV33 TaxID=2795106 RepID=UPI0018EC0ADF|nr:hypothetical protein [Bosea sp. ASV33]
MRWLDELRSGDLADPLIALNVAVPSSCRNVSSLIYSQSRFQPEREQPSKAVIQYNGGISVERWVSISSQINELKSEPWSMFWKEWKSESNEFKEFLLDPLKILKNNDEFRLDGNYSVSSELLNHHIPLTVSIVCTIIIIFPEEKHVKIMAYKHKPELNS